MEEERIQFETAKLAKEKGFNIKCIDFIDIWGEKSSVMSYIGDTFKEKFESCSHNAIIYIPTQSLLQKWLREVHLVDVLVDYDIFSKCGYTFKIAYGLYLEEVEDHSHGDKYGICPFKTYEEALEIGLIEALKLIPLKK